MLRGKGPKERPLVSNWFSSWVSVIELKLMTALVSSCMLWLSCLQYLFDLVLRLWRRLRLRVRLGEGRLGTLVLGTLIDWTV